jgi:hypothetical protein
MRGIFRQENESEVVFFAEVGHNWRQVGSQVVSHEHFNFLLWDGSDVAKEDLFQKNNFLNSFYVYWL